MKEEAPSTPGFRIFMFIMLLLLMLCSYIFAAPDSSSSGTWLLDCAVAGLELWDMAGLWRLPVGASLLLLFGLIWIRTNNVFAMLGMLALAFFCSFPVALVLSYVNSPRWQEEFYLLPPFF